MPQYPIRHTASPAPGFLATALRDGFLDADRVSRSRSGCKSGMVGAAVRFPKPAQAGCSARPASSLLNSQQDGGATWSDDPIHTAISSTGEGRGQRDARLRVTARARGWRQERHPGAHGPDAVGNQANQGAPGMRVEAPRLYGALAQMGEHRFCTPKVAGSIPAGSTRRCVAQPGSASALGAEGRRFKSGRADHNHNARETTP